MIFVTHASRSRSKFFAQIGDQVVVELLHQLQLSLDFARARTRITAREDRHDSGADGGASWWHKRNYATAAGGKKAPKRDFQNIMGLEKEGAS